MKCITAHKNTYDVTMANPESRNDAALIGMAVYGTGYLPDLTASIYHNAEEQNG